MTKDSAQSADLEVSLLKSEKQKTITAIKKLKLRVTPPQLAAESGLSINQSSFWLNKIAGETRGNLEVSADGTIAYSFSPDFTNAYVQHGIKKAALQLGSGLFQITYWLIRVSFGFVLILSILVIVLLIIAIILLSIAAMFSDSGGGGDSGGVDLNWGGSGFFDLDFLGDVFSFNYSPSHTNYYNSRPSVRRQEYSEFVQQHPKGNFFLECFSFLFGDGAPNSNLQVVRWNQIAREIQKNGGVVSAEQLAPYLDGDRSDAGMILTALAHFNGRPEVTKSGYIVYVFPDLMIEGQPEANQPPEQMAPPAVSYLKEEHWQFSAFSGWTQAKVLTLASLNFAGSWFLFKHVALLNFWHPLVYLIDFLLTYAIVFLAIPAGRLIVITILNQRIDARNEKRKKASELVDTPKDDVLAEILEAREIRDAELLALNSDKSIVFTTEKDSLEQQFE